MIDGTLQDFAPPSGDALSVVDHSLGGVRSSTTLAEARKRDPGRHATARSVEVSLAALTADKRRRLAALLSRQRRLIRDVVADLWPTPLGELHRGNPGKPEYAPYAGRYGLTATQAQDAYAQALGMVAGTRKSAESILVAARGALPKRVKAVETAKTRLAKARTTKSRAKAASALAMSEKRERSCRKTIASTVAPKKAPAVPSTLPVVYSNNASSVVDDGRGSYDLVVTMPSLAPARNADGSASRARRKRLVIPSRRTKRLNFWLDKWDAKLSNSIRISEDSLHLVCIVPKPKWREEGGVVGIDMGMRDTLATSDGERMGGISEHYGALHPGTRRNSDRWKYRKSKKQKKRNTIYFRRLHRTSKAKQSRRRAIKHHYDWCVNRLPWETMKMIVIEDLRDMKRGKNPGQSRKMRRTRAGWKYAHVRQRVEQWASVYGVRPMAVYPSGTSTTCSYCGHLDDDNRVGKTMSCVRCGYSTDADLNAAVNIMARGMRVAGHSPSRDTLGAHVSPEESFAIADDAPALARRHMREGSGGGLTATGARSAQVVAPQGVGAVRLADRHTVAPDTVEALAAAGLAPCVPGDCGGGVAATGDGDEG